MKTEEELRGFLEAGVEDNSYVICSRTLFPFFNNILNGYGYRATIERVQEDINSIGFRISRNQ